MSDSIRITRDPTAPGPIVRGFAATGFRVGEIAYPALLLAPDWHEPWSPPPFEALTAEAVAALVDEAPEFLLLGTGATLRRAPAAMVAALEVRGVGVEVMDSRAAARAWGVLRGEGRKLAAALYPLDA
ncbi:MTH938/NDUFAF3 family protein [Sphingomonas sp. CFBP8993]|uniref:Mth938-like domain-containing protein n=1 Tax=Sphingomonas sp. CFBP8993 TaxID=3096526 RepID=UPI002A6998A7|nr:MTH938/NDUFAF3 family protein [Sphingomonas sp. CFBP8993]MDY0958264.1 MTH938/NDUFAF3 family protein [Sphingomonas sp. CFBP8993]